MEANVWALIFAAWMVAFVVAVVYLVRHVPKRVSEDEFQGIDRAVLTAGIVSSTPEHRRIRFQESMDHLGKRERAHREHIRFTNFWNGWFGAGTDTGYLEARREWMLVARGGRHGR